MHLVIPVKSLNLLFAAALSSESKYHTVIAYLQKKTNKIKHYHAIMYTN